MLIPPVISNIQVSSITENSAAVTWTTDESANSKVDYALIPSFTTATTTTDSTNVTSHSVSLTNLTASTIYYYIVISTDASGNIATSSESSFSTIVVPTYTGPPAVSLTSNVTAVEAGEPFILTVSGTASAGLAALWWWGPAGVADATVVHTFPSEPASSGVFTTPVVNPTKLDRAFGSPLFSAGQAVLEYTFTSSVTIPGTGVYTFGANSRDVLYVVGAPSPVPGAHQASEGSGTASVTVTVEQGSPPVYCGDSICNGSENWRSYSCPADCPIPDCIDSDGGVDYFVQGSIPDSPNPWTDYCAGDILHEFSCNPSVTSVVGVTQAFYTCPNGCQDGVCLSAPSSAIPSSSSLSSVLESFSGVLNELRKTLQSLYHSY